MPEKGLSIGACRPTGSIDLHVHTTASDGSLTPVEIAKKAKDSGVAVVAITDHDTTAGAEEGAAKGGAFGVDVVLGVEISADFEAGSVHVLGLFIDARSPELGRMLDFCRRARVDRNPKISAKLRQLGIEVSVEEAEEIAGGKVVGRPHFAHLIWKKGYASSPKEAFTRLLARGAPAYAGRERVSIAEAGRVVSAAGGIPILAHPGLIDHADLGELERKIIRICGEGVEGIEAYHYSHDRRTERFLLDLAASRGFAVSGGSDFHGTVKPEVELGSGCGDLFVPYKVYENLCAKKA